MIKYEFMRAHGKGSEGSEKRGGGAKIKRGCEKKGGARSTGTPPVYAPDFLHRILLSALLSGRM